MTFAISGAIKCSLQLRGRLNNLEICSRGLDIAFRVLKVTEAPGLLQRTVKDA